MMKNKITNFFKKNYPLLGLALLFFLLLLPEIAEAFNFAGNITGPVKMYLSAQSTAYSSWFVIYVIVFVFFILGVAALFLSTTLLQGAIDNSVESLNILQGESAFVVHAGWNFMAGITNMMLLIGFIIIAIAIIMGSDSYGLKKAMPQLILVAFLVNFTLLFVGMGVDITNTIYNTIANQFSQDGGNLLWEAITPLFGLGTRIIAGTVAFLVGISIVKSTGFGAIGAFYLFGVGFVAFLPFIIQFIIIGIIMFLLSITFLTFYAVFVMRGLIISILAIISPLAFFCLIFPSTRKYFNMWLEHLTQWLLVGVTFIFLMYVALALAPFAMQLGEETESAVPFFLRWWSGSIVPYIILLLYFIAILGISKSLIPKLASMAIDQGKNAVGVVAPYVQTAGSFVSRNFKSARSEAIVDKRNRDPQTFDSQLNAALTAPLEGNVFQKAGLWARRQHAASQKSAIGHKKLAAEEQMKHWKDNNEEPWKYRQGINDHLAKGNYEEAAMRVVAASKHDIKIDDVIAKIGVEDYKKMLAKAKEFDEDKTLKNKMFLQAARAEGDKDDKTLEGVTKELVMKSDKDTIGKMSGPLMETLKNGSNEQKEVANQILRAITEGDKNIINALLQKGGKEAFDAMINQYASVAQNDPKRLDYLIKLSESVAATLMKDEDRNIATTEKARRKNA